MAKTTKELVDNVANQATGPTEIEEEEFTPDDIAMENIVNTLIDEAQSSVRIFRVGKHGKDLTFIDEVAPGDFQLGMLKHPPYNGGVFRVYGIMNGKIAGSRILKVDAPPPQDVKSTGDMGAVLSAIQEQGKQTQQAIIELAKVLAPQKQESKVDWIREMIMMKELFNQSPSVAPQPEQGLKSSLALLKEVLEVKDMVGGGDSGASPMMAMGMKLLEKLPELAQAQAQANANAQMQHPPQVTQPVPLAQPNFSVSQQVPVYPPSQMESPNMNEKTMLDMVINAAETKGSITWWADTIAENLPDELWDILPRSDWFEEFVKVEPRITKHRDWFQQVRDKIIADYELPITEVLTNPQSDSTKESPPIALSSDDTKQST